MAEPPQGRWRRELAVFRSRRMAVLLLLGFSSGLPRLLVGSTLVQWFKDEHIDNTKIAALSLIAFAYTFKFAAAPLLDRYRLPFLGRRRGWILVFQLALIAAIAELGSCDPTADPVRLAELAVVVAVCSALQDVMIDAYTVDVLDKPQRGAGTAMSAFGYRIAMLIAGSLAVLLADHVAWQVVYWIMAACMPIGIVGTFLAEEPVERTARLRSITEAIVRPFTELWTRLGWRSALLLIAFAMTYKLGEQYAGVLTGSFYRDLGYTKTELALANKAVGFLATAAGGALGGVAVKRYGVRRMLVVFGIGQSLTHVAYLVVALVGKNLPVFCVALFIENVSAATATIAFLAALITVCNAQVSATQYALLTSLTTLGGNMINWTSGPVADSLGWPAFFVITIAIGVPGILLAWYANVDEMRPATRPEVDTG